MDSTSMTWIVNIAAGKDVTFVLQDGSNQQVYSGPQVIRAYQMAHVQEMTNLMGREWRVLGLGNDNIDKGSCDIQHGNIHLDGIVDIMVQHLVHDDRT